MSSGLPVYLSWLARFCGITVEPCSLSGLIQQSTGFIHDTFPEWVRGGRAVLWPMGVSPSGKGWWQWGRAWGFSCGLFTISAHISLVRTSLMAPPKYKGFGKFKGADGTFGEYHCLITPMISAGTTVSSSFRTHSGDPVGLRRNEGLWMPWEN